MTDSNLQFSDTDKKDSNLEFSETKDDANLEFGNQTQSNNLEFSSEKKELRTNQNETNFKTDFGSSLFNENLSLIDFNTEFDFSDTVNSLFLNQNDGLDVKEQDFNADEHEAITNIPAPSEELKGKVIEVVEKGYTLNGKIIRFPKVVVGA